MNTKKSCYIRFKPYMMTQIISNPILQQTKKAESLFLYWDSQLMAMLANLGLESNISDIMWIHNILM